jgi:hypothetical protein
MKQRFPTCVACLILGVSPFPWLLFYQGARDEPFNVFQARDAIYYLGFGSALLVVLVELAGVVVFGMATRRLSGWWSATLLWLAILIFLSFASATCRALRYGGVLESNGAMQRPAYRRAADLGR